VTNSTSHSEQLIKSRLLERNCENNCTLPTNNLLSQYSSRAWMDRVRMLSVNDSGCTAAATDSMSLRLTVAAISYYNAGAVSWALGRDARVRYTTLHLPARRGVTIKAVVLGSGGTVRQSSRATIPPETTSRIHRFLCFRISC